MSNVIAHITALTDVLYAEVRHPKGTEFAIVEEPKPDQKPVQVDATTASRWLRDRWADPLATGTAKAPK